MFPELVKQRPVKNATLMAIRETGFDTVMAHRINGFDFNACLAMLQYALSRSMPLNLGRRGVYSEKLAFEMKYPAIFIVECKDRTILMVDDINRDWICIHDAFVDGLG